MRPIAFAPVLGAIVLALSGCGAPNDPAASTDAGYAALGRGEADSALDHFVDALDALAPGDPGFARARMGAVEAKARLRPDTAADSFLAWSRAHPEQVSAADHHRVGALLASLSAFDPAIDVLSAGRARFPEDAKLDAALDALTEAAARHGDERILARLEGLGYVGTR